MSAAAMNMPVRAAGLAKSHASFGGAIRSEWRKALSLRSTWVLLILNAVLLAFGGAFFAWAYTVFMTDGEGSAMLAGDQFWYAVTSMTTNCMIVVGIYGVMAITTEYSTGSIQASLTVDPNRVRFFSAKGVVTALLTFASSLVGVLISWGLVSAILSNVEILPLGAGEAAIPWVKILGAPAMLALAALIAQGLGGLCRSTVGGLFAYLGLIMIVPTVLQVGMYGGQKFAWTQSLAHVLPDAATGIFIEGGGESIASSTAGYFEEGTVYTPLWWQAGLIVLAWAAVCYAIGLLTVRSRDLK